MITGKKAQIKINGTPILMGEIQSINFDPIVPNMHGWEADFEKMTVSKVDNLGRTIVAGMERYIDKTWWVDPDKLVLGSAFSIPAPDNEALEERYQAWLRTKVFE